MTTYYIDPDLGTGTGDGSIGDPFKSWSEATFSSGNSYLQKAGSTFIGNVQINAHGSSGNEIVISTYGGSDRATRSY